MNEDDYRAPRKVADYIWNVTIALPIVMAFVPGLWPLALHGFTALAQAPEWYKLAVETCLAFAFGSRGLDAASRALIALKALRQSATQAPTVGT